MQRLSLGNGAFRYAAWMACALAVGTAPAAAQRDSVRVVVRGNAPAGFEAEVERVARQLLEKRRLQVMLVRTLQGLTVQLQQLSNDTERARLQQELRTVRTRLATTGSEGAELRRELGSLCLEDRLPDGWLGIVLDADVELKREQNGDVSSRYLGYPEIVSVEPGSPAQKAGIEAGDRLLSLSGRDVRSANLGIGSMLRPGARLTMRVRRGLESRTVQVLVERRPDSYDPPCRWIDQSIADALREVPDERVFVLPDPASPPEPGVRAPRPAIVRVPPPQTPSAVPPDMPAPAAALGPMFFTLGQNATGTIAGAQLTAMNEELGETFGVDRGLLVLLVLPGTPAEQSGLRGGDVILSANGSALAQPTGLLRAINGARSREVQLKVIRKKKPISVALRW